MAAKKEKILSDEEKYLPHIKPGTPAMESLLAAGYPKIRTKAHALEIIKTRKENPALIPFELAEDAQAFLDALEAKSEVIDPEPGKLDELQRVE